jgi:hypothetical protein
MSEPLRFDGTCGSCVFQRRLSDSIFGQCRVCYLFTRQADPCHCPTERAEAIRAQTAGGTDGGVGGSL